MPSSIKRLDGRCIKDSTCKPLLLVPSQHCLLRVSRSRLSPLVVKDNLLVLVLPPFRLSYSCPSHPPAPDIARFISYLFPCLIGHHVQAPCIHSRILWTLLYSTTRLLQKGAVPASAQTPSTTRTGNKLRSRRMLSTKQIQHRVNKNNP